MKQLILLCTFILFAGYSCVIFDESPDCIKVFFNDGLYDDGPEDISTHIVSYQIIGDCLELEVRYSGGCEEHEINLAARGWVKTNPPKVEARIVHDNIDPCEAEISENLSFDLTELKYPENERLIISLKGLDTLIEHNFTD